jgi:hypothetical protein
LDNRAIGILRRTKKLGAGSRNRVAQRRNKTSATAVKKKQRENESRNNAAKKRNEMANKARLDECPLPIYACGSPPHTGGKA